MTIEEIREACEHLFQNGGSRVYRLTRFDKLHPSFQSPGRALVNGFPGDRVFARMRQPDGTFKWEEKTYQSKPSASQLDALKKIAGGADWWSVRHSHTRAALSNNGWATMADGITPLGRRTLEVNK